MSLMTVSHITSHQHSYSNHTVSVWSQCHMRILILSEDQLEVILYLTPSCLFKALTDYLISVELDTLKHQAGLLWCHPWQSDSQIQKQFCHSPICFKQYFWEVTFALEGILSSKNTLYLHLKFSLGSCRFCLRMITCLFRNDMSFIYW